MSACLICENDLDPPGLPKLCGACSHKNIRLGDLSPDARERVLQATVQDLMTPEELTKFSSFVERHRPRWEAFAGPGTPWRDTMDLLHIAHGNHDRLTPEEEDAVLQRLAARARVFVRGEAWQVLTQRASKARLQPRELLQRDIVPAAILLVIAESMTPQRLQIGRTRISTPEGTWPPLSPMSLLPWQYVQWFWQQVPKAVTAVLLDQPYPQTPPAPPVEWVAPEVALSPEAIVQARSLLHAVWHVASPQQQDILRLLLLEESTVAEVAARLRVRRAHVYAQLDRLQAKIQDL